MKFRSGFFLPSIGHMLFISLFLTLSVAGKGLLNDGDTAWHIQTGNVILETFSIPKHDIFSFSPPHHAWINHDWLSQVILALIHRSFGLSGIVVFFSFLISLIYYLLFKMLRKSGVNIIFTVLILLLAIMSSNLNWFARPNVISLLLFMIWYHLLDAFQYGHKKYFYLLPPMMLIWANLHGGFIFGFILIGIYFLGNLLQSFLSKGAEKTSYLEKSKLIGMMTAGCLFASLINPFSYHVLLIPLRLKSIEFVLNQVQEFSSPNFHEPGIMPFKYLMLLMIAIMGMSRRGLNMIELILILCFTNMALYAVRFIPPFAIIVSPILGKRTEVLLGQSQSKMADLIREKANNIASFDASSKGYVWVVGAVLMVALALISGRLEHNFDREKMPLGAVDFLKKIDLRGNMFNDFSFGGYLIYSAYPNYKVFIDGRTYTYGNERVKEYLTIDGLKPGWEEVIEKYHIDWIIFSANSMLSRFLLEKHEWRLIYADRVANIFVKDIPQNRGLIERFGDATFVPTATKRRDKE